MPYAQLPPSQLQQMTFALRTDGDPLRHVNTARQIVHGADSRVPMTNVVTQAADINRMINQEIVMARLGTTFAILALVIACVGLYGTMSYGVARRTREIGIRVALGARRGRVVWMVMRDVCILTALGLLISIPIVRADVTLGRVVPVRDQAQRPARHRAGGVDAGVRRTVGRLWTGAAGLTHRSGDGVTGGVRHRKGSKRSKCSTSSKGSVLLSSCVRTRNPTEQCPWNLLEHLELWNRSNTIAPHG